jgi:outer membrane protein assembly factor BamB
MLDRAKTLDAGAAAIKKAAEAGDVAGAAAERAKLLAIYPDAAGESSLRDLGPAWATAAAGKVQTAEYSQPAETTEKPTGIVGSVVFTTSLKAIAASEAGPPAIFAAGSSVWGVDSATGRVLWRRTAGGAHWPVRLGADAASDVLLVDSASSDVVRAATQSGAIKWRHQLGGPIAGSPVVVGSRVLVTKRSGQVVAVDAESGFGQLSAQLPQSVRVGAITDASGQHLVQLADHSLLYVLAAADLKCVRAVFVGHEPAAVVVAPTMLPKHMVIAENRGSAASTLHVLALDAGGLPQVVVQQIEFAGHVLASPVVLTGRLIVATDQGRVLAYESAADPTAGLKEVAKAEAGSTAGITRFPALIQGNLLIAGQGLRQFGPPAAGSLKPAWSALADDILLGPPQVVADTIVTIRRQPGSPGIVAAGLNPADGKPRWETRLGEPLQSIALTSDSGSITASTTSGASATLAAADLSGPKVAPLRAAPSAASQGPPSDERASQSIAWREGVIAASPSGAISYVDPKSGSLQADPLQLRLRPGERLDDCRLAVAGEKGNQLVVSDGQQSLYVVDLAGEGGQQLVELAWARLESSPMSGLAVGDQVVGLVDRRGRLVTFTLPDLKPATSLDLKADAIVAGPTRIGDVVVLATDRGELLGLDRSLAQSWKVPLPHGPLAGDFVADGAGILVACQSGWLCRLKSSSGEEIAAVDLGQPLAGTPLVAGGAAIVSTADGAVLKVSFPAEKGAAP